MSAPGEPSGGASGSGAKPPPRPPSRSNLSMASGASRGPRAAYSPWESETMPSLSSSGIASASVQRAASVLYLSML